MDEEPVIGKPRCPSGVRRIGLMTAQEYKEAGHTAPIDTRGSMSFVSTPSGKGGTVRQRKHMGASGVTSTKLSPLGEKARDRFLALIETCPLARSAFEVCCETP